MLAAVDRADGATGARLGDAVVVRVGVIAYAVLLAMVLTSTDAARKALGRGWKWLHTIGIWGFVLIFGHPDGFPLTDPYFVIAAAAVGLKLAAFVQARRKRTRRAA